MAYVMGLLWADGCVTTRNSRPIAVSLELKDIWHLEDVARVIDPVLAVHTYRRKDGRTTARFEIRVQEVVQDCLVLGLIPQKSLTAEWPRGLPYNLEADFVRGYFDGDGCVSCAKRYNEVKKDYRIFNFSVASPVLARELLKCIRRHTKVIGKIKASKPTATVLYYTGIQKMRAIGAWMYSGKSKLRMIRKHEMWLLATKQKASAQIEMGQAVVEITA